MKFEFMGASNELNTFNEHVQGAPFRRYIAGMPQTSEIMNNVPNRQRVHRNVLLRQASVHRNARH